MVLGIAILGIFDGSGLTEVVVPFHLEAGKLVIYRQVQLSRKRNEMYFKETGVRANADARGMSGLCK
jgi:hypothetical protein